MNIPPAKVEVIILGQGHFYFGKEGPHEELETAVPRPLLEGRGGEGSWGDFLTPSCVSALSADFPPAAPRTT